jgi:hypothetical protein
MRFDVQWMAVLALGLGLLSGCGETGAPGGTAGTGGTGGNGGLTAAEPTLGFGLKTFRFSWTDSSGADFYRLFEDPDGVSGFTQVSPDVAAGVQVYDHIVALYQRINARYILKTCNATGCADSQVVNISDTLVDAIGYFKAGNPGANDGLGISVSLAADGSTLAVGAPGEDSDTAGVNTTPNDDGSADNSGAVYVFTSAGGTWSQQAYIKANNTSAGDRFGNSVSLAADGNTLAIGAVSEDSNSTGVNSTPNDDGTADDSGAVYVFTRAGSTWSQQAYIKAGNAGANDSFGHSVSLAADGDTLGVVANLEDSATVGVNPMTNDIAADSGAAYVFVRAGGAWSQQAYIKASNTGARDRFGNSISLAADGNTLAVGATDEDSGTSGVNTTPNDDGSADDSGAVYVFTRAGVTWSQQAYIKASNTGTGDRFGNSVSLAADGNTLAVGATDEDSGTSGVNTAPNDDGSADDSGAVYVFTRAGVTWSQQAYIKTGDTGAGDFFGSTVSLAADGNTLAAGAPGEDSNTSGVNSTPNDDGSADFSGAVYVFTRAGGTWTQQAYLKAANTGAGDELGYYSISLAADGKTLAIGADEEDSNSTGIDSAPNDDGNANGSGAVYLY